MNLFFKRILIFTICLIFTCTLAASAEIVSQVNADVTSQLVTAPSAILIEHASGQVLYELNPDEKLHIASVTKTMTMLLIMEAIDSGKIALTDTVTTSEYASSMGGSQVFLEPGEQMSVEDMLKNVYYNADGSENTTATKTDNDWTAFDSQYWNIDASTNTFAWR